MEIAPALLEDYLRDYYFTSDIDIGSSGVQDFSLAEIRQHTGLTHEELDAVVFRDSPSCGDDDLRRLVARRWGNGNPERAMMTTGSNEAIFLIMHALLRAGDEVIVLDPCYYSLVNVAESLGCQLKYWRLQFANGFVPDIEEVRSLITPRTRMVVVNFPHNPTGASLTPEQQAELSRLVAEAGAYLVWDGAFAELTYEREPLPNPGLDDDRVISIGTLSKAYGLPGLRFGWCLASPGIIAELVHLRDYTSLYLSPLVEAIARRVIENADRLLEIRVRQARANLEVLKEWMGRNVEMVEWAQPQGGVTAFPRLRHIPDVARFCNRLSDEHKVLLVPGVCFKHPEHVRLGFGGPTWIVREGLSRLSAMLETVQAERLAASSAR
jgi:capreomycidine synthase